MKRTLVLVLVSAVILAGCSSIKTAEHQETIREPATEKSVAEKNPEPGFTPPIVEHSKDKHADEQPAVVIQQLPSAVPHDHSAQTDAHPGDHHAAPATTPNDSIADRSVRWLENGNKRYVTRHFRGDGRLPADRERNKLSQKPHAIALSCSDSRVPPEVVFDQGIGEIFVVRVAGEALDATSLASVEYAVEHLGPHLIVVMGHTRCGAVDAAIKIKEGTSAGSESLDRLLAEIRPHLKTISTEHPSTNLEVESALNADGVARDLIKRSELIRHKVEKGELKIKSALYWIDSGKVKFY